ncbi:hypothetical protein OAI84_00335, partial [bacterium]|nr:hypothetical protein [bacterium]
LGMCLIRSNDILETSFGYLCLERAFDSHYVNEVIPINCYQGKLIAFIVGRYNYQMNKYKTAEKFFKLADSSEICKDDSQKILLATNISGFPESIEDAKNKIKTYNSRIDNLLDKNKIEITFFQSNVYNNCVLSPFNLEIYYEADFRSCMEKYYKLVIKLFPDLNYISPDLQNNSIFSKKPYKIGIASAFYSKNNSVIADFGGVIKQLPKDIFDITYIYIVENNYDKNNFVFINEKHIIIDSNSGPDWLGEARKKISILNLDLLFYLESTMSPCAQMVMMSKLAKVQAVSHGHPVTSGIDKEIMNYYISWGAAELDYETAKNHYTEELILLPKNSMHQYYEHRTLPGMFSAIDNMCFKNFKRNNFSQYVPNNGTWYICMQKPFKRHPEFYYMLASILKKDPNGRLILHDTDKKENKQIVESRLKNQNINMSRVHFIPPQPHYKLMGLYMLSDVILDSYHAGGCTTTREALEIGAVVVTLPSKYLGGRWSLAYYNIIGVLDVIAKDKEDYINLAVKMGTNMEARKKVKKSILENVHKLFHSREAIESWANSFIKIINSVNIDEEG